jgi:prepilin-type N-terminal cleavage/methylation domain-containing protein
MNNKNKSFTLIELLVVIVIIGILAGVVMISTSSSIDKANIAKVKVFEESVSNNLAANMISAWDADHVTKDTTWTLNDKWGNNNGTFYDGTVTTCSSSACPQIVNDKQMGSVLSFDGVNDYIQVDDVYCNSLNGMTWSVWVKFNEIKNCFILDQRELEIGYQPFYLASNGDIQFYNTILKNNTYFDTNLKTNQWYLLTATTENNLVKFYLNGSYFISKEDTSYDFGVKNLMLGSRHNNTVFFNGLIDDVRIYNAALSSSQIKQNYIAGLNSMLANGNISKKEYNKRINTLAYDN